MTLENIDLRSRLSGGPRDQGHRPTCLAFALSSAHEGERASEDFPHPELSPEAIWSHAARRGRAGARGISIGAAEAALKEVGQPALADWPYDIASPVDAPATLKDPPWLRASTIPLRLHHDAVEQDLEDALAANHLIVLEVAVTKEFDWPDGTAARIGDI
jgi:hypothetical protein